MKQYLVASLLTIGSTQLMWSDPVSAFTLEQTVTDFSRIIRFDGFDSSLGTLTDVSLDYNLSVNAGGFDPFGLCQFFRDCEGFFILEIDGSQTFSSLLAQDIEFISNFDVDNGIIVNLSLSDMRSFNLNSFVDVATVGNIFVDLFVTGDLSINPFINLFSSNILGSMTLNYEYTPVSEEDIILDIAEPINNIDVPEPTTILGLVAVGAGLIASKRKKHG
ncbi:MAG: PEP-CTERM sorting domain-containing protein [Crocosphaera sp.]